MSKEAGVSRRERELDPSDPIHAFAVELRKARAQAGSPPYLVMARRSGGVSRTALSEAAGGDHLPKWPTVEGFFRACKMPVPPGLLERWERLQEQPKATVTAGSASAAIPPDRSDGQEMAGPPQMPSRPVRWLQPAITATLVVATAIAVHVTDVVMAPARASTLPKPAALAVIVVQNKVAMGRSDLLEDKTPAFLSGEPVPYCAEKNCVVAGTDWETGVAVIADCKVMSTMMYNYNLDSSEVQTNPNRAASPLWYHVVLPNGVSGFISEVYIEPRYRGGLGLPVCKPVTP